MLSFEQFCRDDAYEQQYFFCIIATGAELPWLRLHLDFVLSEVDPRDTNYQRDPDL
jgi:hypothetical protein